MEAASERQKRLRAIPAVHELLERPRGRELARRYGREQASSALARAQQRLRARLLAAGEGELGALAPSAEALLQDAAWELARLSGRHLRPLINATGVVVHTNLGRSPLAESALEAMVAAARGYSTLEYDLEEGGRGSRHQHVQRLLPRLTGAEAGIAVNNNAAAVLLVLSALAAGREVVVSRGELVEIGGSFRIPEVLAQSGARLREVGTTNKTHAGDYRRAITPETAAILKVHASNYRIVGFASEVPVPELVGIGADCGVPVVYDLGSGVLADLEARGLAGEPTVRGAVEAGAALVTFSGDKLLGGPQAGLIVGRHDLVRRCAAHPLARALRIDKMTAAALEATLLLYLQPQRALEAVPTLRMLLAPEEALAARAEDLAARLRERLGAAAAVEVVRVASQPGGGSLPGVDVPSRAVALTPGKATVSSLERALRRGEPPVVARIEDDRLLLDLRTVAPGEEEERLLAAVVRGAGVASA